MDINENIRRFFWDVDPVGLNLKKNSGYIIARILEFGDTEAIAWLFRTYNKKIIRGVLINQRGFSRRTANFWSKILDIDKNEIQCLKKSYQKIQKAHWPY